MKMGPPPSKTGKLVVRGKSIADPNARRPSTMTIRRTGSIGNLPKAVISAQQRIDSSSCHYSNVPLTDPSNQQEQYTKSLEQQVQLLELENMFLKRDGEARSSYADSKCETILSRGNEVSLNGKDWCRLPDFHPKIEKIIQERISRSDQGSTRGVSSIQGGDKRVSARDSGRSSQVVERIDTTLLQQLEEKNQEVDFLSEKLKEQARLAKQSEDKAFQLQLRLREAESDLSSRSEADTRDKKAMIEEMLELQRRLDGLTPVLAEKESRIVRIENERDALTSKIRNLNNELATVKLQLAETRQEEQLRDERESADRLEKTKMRESIEENMEKLLETSKQLEEAVIETQILQRQIKEEQLRRSNDNRLIQQMTEENSKLIQENSKITTELARTEYELNRLKEESSRNKMNGVNSEQIVELRLMAKAHLTTIGILEERLKASHNKVEVLETELASRWEVEESVQNERTRTQKELEALEALSKSLSNENKTLREEKILLTDRVDNLKRKINSRDFQIKNLEEEMVDMEKKHTDDVKRAEAGTRVNSQRALELEELSRRIRELSDSLPSDSRRSQSSSSAHTSQSEHRFEHITRTDNQRIEIPLFRSGHPPTIPEEPELSCGSMERFLRS